MACQGQNKEKLSSFRRTGSDLKFLRPNIDSDDLRLVKYNSRIIVKAINLVKMKSHH